jgi:2-keto-3-deoxy-L-rhamnonate aldolase RhmA
MRDMGFRFIAVKSDSMMLTESAEKTVNTLKNIDKA